MKVSDFDMTQISQVETYKNALLSLFDKLPRLSISEKQELTRVLFANCSIIERKSGDVLLHSGRYSGCFYVCLSGLLRNYYLLENGKEFNKSFIDAPSMAGALSEYVNDEPSRFSIDCIEDSVLLKIPFEFLRKFEHQPSVEKLYLHVVETLAILKEKREASLLIDNAELRYKTFLKEYPALIERLPDYHIASYIGITPVALSRLKKSLFN